jgi:hypothetical protein
MTVVIVRRDLMGSEMPPPPNILKWKKMDDAGSMLIPLHLLDLHGGALP